MEIRQQSAFTALRALLPQTILKSNLVGDGSPQQIEMAVSTFFLFLKCAKQPYSLQRAPTADPAGTNYPSSDTVPLRLSPVHC
jgi:hypothetical protein